MNKRENARAIIIKDNELLTIFRRKNTKEGTKEYYVIPGGGVEDGETLADTVKRELQEELDISIEVGNFLTQVISDTTISNFFECKILSGTPKIGGEELERMNIDNYYEVRFIPFEKLDSLNLMPPEIKTYIIKEYLK